jgi:hypothetical protein
MELELGGGDKQKESMRAWSSCELLRAQNRMAATGTEKAVYVILFKIILLIEAMYPDIWLLFVLNRLI